MIYGLGPALDAVGACISKFTAEAAGGFIFAPPLLPHRRSTSSTAITPESRFGDRAAIKGLPALMLTCGYAAIGDVRDCC